MGFNRCANVRGLQRVYAGSDTAPKHGEPALVVVDGIVVFIPLVSSLSRVLPHCAAWATCN